MPSTPHCTNLNDGKLQGTHHQQSYFTSPIYYSSPVTMMNGSNEYHITPPSHINESFEFDQGHVSQSMPYYIGNYSKIPMSNEVTYGMENQPPFPSQRHVQSSTPRRKRKSDKILIRTISRENKFMQDIQSHTPSFLPPLI
uniref:Ovule protein n=1 Tax=Strongyloides venezuelensis TaxID=75913 RepID=A0A0K0G1K1_STRVS